MAGDEDQARDLDVRLAPFLAAMGRKTRRHWAPFYLRGLLGPGDRKSLQPMAAWLGLPGHDHRRTAARRRPHAHAMPALPATAQATLRS